MNNLFVFVFVSIIFLICPNYGFGDEDKGTAKKKNGGGQKSLQDVNGIIPMKESSNNNISLKCCECLCNGKDISNNGKTTHLNAKRVKRAYRANGQCSQCGALYNNSSYCYNCVRLGYTQHQPYTQHQHYTQECAHCTNRATAHDYHGNPACHRRKFY
jgi:hypothetical protein